MTEIRGNIRAGDRTHADCLGAIADTFARTVALMGHCRFPLYTNGDMAQEWFDSWKLINMQRAERNGRPFLNSSTETGAVRPRIAFFLSVVRRSHGRFRRKYLRARSLSPHQELDVWEDGHHSAEPSDGEDLPV